MVTLLLAYSCQEDMIVVEPQIETPELGNNFELIVDGVEVDYSFEGCSNLPSIYRTKSTNEFESGKNLIRQSLDSIPISSELELSYKLYFYSSEDLNSLSIEDMKQLIIDNPEIVSLEVALKQNNTTYQNQYYEWNNLIVLYQDRNIVAENEEYKITAGNVNEFDCVLNRKTLEFEVEYSGILKTESEMESVEISLDMKIHLMHWN